MKAFVEFDHKKFPRKPFPRGPKTWLKRINNGACFHFIGLSHFKALTVQLNVCLLFELECYHLGKS